MKLSPNRQTEEQYRVLMECLPDCGIFLLDSQGIIQTWNSGIGQLMGYTAPEVLGSPYSIFNLPEADQNGPADRGLAMALQHGRFEQAGWQVRKDKSRFWASVVLTPVYDDEQHLAGFAVVIRALTGQMPVEKARLVSEDPETDLARLLATVIEKSPAGITIYEAVYDSHHQLVDFTLSVTNPANAVTSGLALEELVNHSLKTLFPQVEQNVFWQKLVACYETGQSQELSGHYTAYGLDIWIEGHFYKVGSEVLWVGLDVTQLKQAQLELEKQIISLQEAKQQVDIDLVRLRVAEREVSRALDREREMNKLKTEFINLVSHQFRNPLTSIFLKAEALKRLSERCSDRAFAHRIVEYVEQVGRDIHRLNKLVNEVLFNERMRLGQVEIHQSSLNLAEFCRTWIQQQRQHDPAYQRVDFDSRKAVVLVWADRILLEQVLENLLSNALKYSADSAKSIEVSLDETPEGWVLSVKDYGIGIPPEDMKYIAKSFYRASNTTHYPGTGLGLSLSDQLVSMHGGTLTIESEQGQYTLCRVCLPKPASGS